MSCGRGIILFLIIKNRICCRIVVHLHLAINLHVLSTMLDVIEQLVDGKTEIFLLFEEDVQLRLTFFDVFWRSICTLRLLFHVINLQCKDRQAIYCPCWTFGINSSIWERRHIRVELTEI